MRMDVEHTGISAADLVNTLKEAQLEKLFLNLAKNVLPAVLPRPS